MGLVAGVATLCSPSMRPLAGHPHAVGLATHTHTLRTRPPSANAPTPRTRAHATHPAWLRTAHVSQYRQCLAAAVSARTSGARGSVLAGHELPSR